jgi:hypothetical protein
VSSNCIPAQSAEATDHGHVARRGDVADRRVHTEGVRRLDTPAVAIGQAVIAIRGQVSEGLVLPHDDGRRLSTRGRTHATGDVAQGLLQRVLERHRVSDGGERRDP